MIILFNSFRSKSVISVADNLVSATRANTDFALFADRDSVAMSSFSYPQGWRPHARIILVCEIRAINLTMRGSCFPIPGS